MRHSGRADAGTVQAMAARENFAADAKELIVSALEPVRARVMADDSILPSNKNKAIVEELDQKGMFRLKDSVVFVARAAGHFPQYDLYASAQPSQAY